MTSTVVAVHPNQDLYGSDRMFLASVTAIANCVTVRPVVPGAGALAEALGELKLTPTPLSFPVLRKRQLRRPLAALLWVAQFVVAVPRLAVWLRKQDAKTLYVNTTICPVWVMAGRLSRCKVVVHVHESEVNMPAVLQRLLLAQLRLAHHVVANSDASARWVAKAGRSVRARTGVIHNGVPAPQADTQAAWHDEAVRHLVILGRLNERKGQHVAIDVLARLRRKGIDVGLTIIGDSFPGYEWYARKLREQAIRVGVHKHVHFLAFVKNPAPYLAEADVVLAPSTVESFGNAAVEALMVGTPVVAYAAQGLTEVIRHNKTGLLVPVGDEAGMYAATRELLENTVRAEALGRAAREDAIERFGMQKYAHELIQALGVSST
jgi:glycosyltransferase involved in cell wall biosynthesis